MRRQTTKPSKAKFSPRSIRRSKMNIKIDTDIPSRGSSFGDNKKEDEGFPIEANLANQLYFESRRKRLSDEWDLQLQPRRSSSLNGHDQPALFAVYIYIYIYIENTDPCKTKWPRNS